MPWHINARKTARHIGAASFHEHSSANRNPLYIHSSPSTIPSSSQCTDPASCQKKLVKEGKVRPEDAATTAPDLPDTQPGRAEVSLAD